jgi:hypothetical protein
MTIVPFQLADYAPTFLTIGIIIITLLLVSYWTNMLSKRKELNQGGKINGNTK